MSLTEGYIAEMRAKLEPLVQAKKRAKELSTTVPKAKLFVGVCGTGLEFEQFEILHDFLYIRTVTNAPGPVHIQSAANTQLRDYLAVGMYVHAVQAELDVGNAQIENHNDETFLLGLAWHIAALLKLLNHQTLFCPVAASASWDTISAISDNSVSFRLLDDTPRHVAITHKSSNITLEDMEWVKSNWETALNLRNQETSRRFGLAFETAYIWNYTHDPRIAMAHLWCGIEALFGETSDGPDSDALAERISDWLPSVSVTDALDLSKQRCDLIHGHCPDKESIADAITRSFSILRQSIVKCIETNRKTLEDCEESP